MALTSQNGKGTPAREPGGNDQFVSGRSVAVTGQNSCPPAGRYLAVCGQSLVTAVNGAGPVSDGAVADLAAGDWKLGNGHREAAGR